MSSEKISQNKKHSSFSFLEYEIFMRNLFLSFLIVVLGCLTTASAAIPLSDSARISLLTCSPGEELYSRFGHTALRVQDFSQHLDIVFNYGMFNFNTPNFYGKFIAGETYYQLGVEDMNSFVLGYVNNGRGIRETDLNLTVEEKQRLFDALIENAKEENRTYLYNFVFDNCATRPRDMIEAAVEGGYLNYPEQQSSALYSVEEQNEKTYRQLIGEYVGEDTWLKFGIDLLIGTKADNPVPQRYEMFLPDELEACISGATKVDGTSLRQMSDVLLEQKAFPSLESGWCSPLLISISLLLFVCLLTLLLPGKLLTLDFLLFLTSGCLGLLLFYLTFFSLHPLVKWNLNLLWLNPAHLLFVLLLPFKKCRRVLSYYQLLISISLVFTISGYLYFPQEYNVAFLPLMLMLFIRAIIFFRYHRADSSR